LEHIHIVTLPDGKMLTDKLYLLPHALTSPDPYGGIRCAEAGRSDDRLRELPRN